MALFPLALPSPSGAAPGVGIPKVGELAKFPDDAVRALGDRILPDQFAATKRAIGGTLVHIPSVRELWQVYPLTNDMTSNGAGGTAIAVRDEATLRLRATFELPFPLRRTGSTDSGEWMHAIDGGRRIFFLRGNRSELVEVDLRTRQHRVVQLSPPVGIPNQGWGGVFPGSLTYDPFDDAIITGHYGIIGTSGGVPVTIVNRLPLKDTAQQRSRVLRTCNGPFSPADSGTTYQFEVIVTQSDVYIPCQRAGAIGAVARIARADLTNQATTETIVSGPAYLDTALADPASGRIFLITISGEIWTFETSSMAFIGVIAAKSASGGTSPSGYGLDRATGRLFFLSASFGLGIAEGRFYPIPQALTDATVRGTGRERLIGDARTGRVFVLRGAGTVRGSAYEIYDTGEAPAPPPPPNPDRNTNDMEEQPGVTDSRYFANGNGYGVRAILAKGIVAVPPSPGIGEQAPTGSVFTGTINSKCGFNDRELVAGRVAKAEYDTGSTAAQAVGVDVDERTKLDLEHLERCDLTSPQRPDFNGIFGTAPLSPHCTKVSKEAFGDEDTCGRKWKAQPAYCTSSSGGYAEGKPRSENEAPSNASVTCPPPGGPLSASSTGYLTGQVTVGRAHTTVDIARDAKGVYSRVFSIAQDIDVAGAVFIGEIQALATSRSNGRPNKDPMSTYEFVIKGMRAGGVSLCEEYRSKGGKQNCDIDAVTGHLNAALAGRLEFRLSSGLDDALLKGSPKGALTGVQKSTARQASDQALVGDKSTEVAALQVTVYNDNFAFGRARQVYQFAGVSSAATYNIAPVLSGVGFDDLPTDPSNTFSLSGPDTGMSGGGEATELGGTLTAAADGSSGKDSGIAGAVNRALRAVARGIRMFLTNPRQALLLLTAWSLFSLAPVLSRRRRLLNAARSD